MAERRQGSRAIVVGASMAGLCAARVLSQRFGEVVVIDHDELSGEPAFRRGVPQARHAHALLLSGQQRLQTWFPGLGGELLAHGALPFRGEQLRWFQAGGVRRRPRDADSYQGALCSRPMLEHHVRARVAGLPNVALRHGHVDDVLAGRGARSAAVSVTGVRLAGDEQLHADLVVDASGRAARSLRWLERLGLGCVAPPLSAVHVDMGYATRILRRDPGDGRDWRVAIVIGDPPGGRVGVAFALEHDRWMVTLAGFHGDHPPTAASGWAEFAATLPDPVIAELIAEAEPLTAIVPHRMAASLRRHIERLHQRQVAGGLVLLGDAVASFNPVYGQGMSAATLQAEALGTALDRCDDLGARFVRTYNRLAGRAVAAPWRLAVTSDFALSQTTGARPWGSALTAPYLRRLVEAAQHDDLVAQRLTEVTNLLRSPAALLAPPIATRALRPCLGTPIRPAPERAPAPAA
jgi:flavin-dependent dehydrogenase